jgi:hypothetical protein
MGALGNLKDTIKLRLGIFGELLGMLWRNKLWWALPIVIIIFLLIGFLVIAGYSGVGVFIYPLI